MDVKRIDAYVAVCYKKKRKKVKKMQLLIVSMISVCSFNQLDLPEYSSKEQLQERLLLAIHEASEGFGFG